MSEPFVVRDGEGIVLWTPPETDGGRLLHECLHVRLMEEGRIPPPEEEEVVRDLEARIEGEIERKIRRRLPGVRGDDAPLR
ncbi:hypothetical protein [Thermosulfurimonas sp. F29]|uniref:hypothetical protein n=1 Tax=Thermosulfurimonas sp. F29 TaxID=2867247 RepID=UPI001C833339|nr:hypothetical protein [Thermosulfurimonas sp. F29]MBX6423394.1 hypothetical protein [Thermosulfurimonas sp. F29]